MFDTQVLYVPTLVDEETRREIMDEVAKKATNDMVFVEVGAFVGGTVCHLGQRLNELGKTPKIFAIDNWVCSEVSPESLEFIGTDKDFLKAFQDNMERTTTAHLVTTLKGDSIELAATFEDNSIDFLFLDGLHQHPYNENEIKAWLPKMKADSTIAGHDYCSLPYMPEMVSRQFPNHRLTSNRASYIATIGKGLI